MKTVNILLAGCLLVLIAGCENQKAKPAVSATETLRQQNEELKKQLEICKAQNAEQQNQISTLTATGKASTGDIYDLKKVELTKYTNFYDHDKDGKKEKLIVYLKPTDSQGDLIKAAGEVNIQLWDLNQPEASALLAQWDIAADKLGENWFSALLGTNYRFAFDITEKVPDFSKPLTIKTTFKDRLSGKTFSSQKVIEPKAN
ncbi:MAG TPA: hypothetical protein PLP05_08465 [Sedimentisphaerales bacterium]|nr:hypothetical protein [Sedimentisphaerales bacterium]